MSVLIEPGGISFYSIPFEVSKPVAITAFGLGAGSATVEMLRVSGQSIPQTKQSCPATPSGTQLVVVDSQPYDCFKVCAGSPIGAITVPGWYRVVLSGDTTLATAYVASEQVSEAVVSLLPNCGTCEPPEPECPNVSITAVATSTEEIIVTVVSGGPVDISLGGQEYFGITGSQVFGFLTPDTVYTAVATSACGKKATATTRTQAEPVVPPAPTYCPSFRFEACDCTEVGFGYRNNALRDPAATVQVLACDGETVMWVYPAAGVTGNVRHEVPYYDDDAVVGYLANNSDCAPPCPCPQTTVNVAPPQNNITLPAPNVVAADYIDNDGRVRLTLSNGQTITTGPIPACDN